MAARGQRRIRMVATACLAVAGVTIGAASSSTVSAAAPTGYTALVPARLLDTRPGGRSIDNLYAAIGPLGRSISTRLVDQVDAPFPPAHQQHGHDKNRGDHRFESTQPQPRQETGWHNEEASGRNR